MAEKNTPLVNEILERLGKHSEFEIWVKTAKVPKTVIKELCDSLKTQEPFIGQPGRFYTPAITLVTYIYKSWLALNRRRQLKIEGKERWLEMLKTDVELEQESKSSLENIRTKSTEILASFATHQTHETNHKVRGRRSRKPKDGKADRPDKVVTIKPSRLFEAYRQTEDALTRCALVYLLKNNCQVSFVEEDLEQYTKQRRKKEKEIEIERLKIQLTSRVPKGRDLTGEKWLETLEQAVQQVTHDEKEAKSWQANLLRKSSSIPFPVVYETTEDIKWKSTIRKDFLFVLTGWESLSLKYIVTKDTFIYFIAF
nr:type V CRISPR-associated protein Cas12k [Nostoc commune]